ncbi:MAG: hypothetical protein IM567_03995 [Microcystis sp. M59BS1]|nr:hypothetical protein [Microcystis sp. M59BS1]
MYYYISLHPDIFMKLEGYIKKVRDSDQRLLRSTYYGSSGLGMVRYGGINRLNPYLARDLID